MNQLGTKKKRDGGAFWTFCTLPLFLLFLPAAPPNFMTSNSLSLLHHLLPPPLTMHAAPKLEIAEDFCHF